MEGKADPDLVRRRILEGDLARTVERAPADQIRILQGRLGETGTRNAALPGNVYGPNILVVGFDLDGTRKRDVVRQQNEEMDALGCDWPSERDLGNRRRLILLLDRQRDLAILMAAFIDALTTQSPIPERRSRDLGLRIGAGARTCGRGLGRRGRRRGFLRRGLLRQRRLWARKQKA